MRKTFKIMKSWEGRGHLKWESILFTVPGKNRDDKSWIRNVGNSFGLVRVWTITTTNKLLPSSLTYIPFKINYIINYTTSLQPKCTLPVSHRRITLLNPQLVLYPAKYRLFYLPRYSIMSVIGICGLTKEPCRGDAWNWVFRFWLWFRRACVCTWM